MRIRDVLVGRWRWRTEDAIWRTNETGNGRTEDKGDGTALPRAKGDQGVVDTAKEGATEVLVTVAMTVDPQGTAAVVVDPAALAFAKGRPDRGADEGKDRDVVILLAVLHIHPMSVPDFDEVRAAVGGQFDADRLQAKPLAEGVGGVEGLGTHGLAEGSSGAVCVVGFVTLGILGWEDGLCKRRCCEEGVYGRMRDVGELVAPIRGGMSVADRRDLGHNDPDRTRGNGCGCGVFETNDVCALDVGVVWTVTLW